MPQGLSCFNSDGIPKWQDRRRHTAGTADSLCWRQLRHFDTPKTVLCRLPVLLTYIPIVAFQLVAFQTERAAAHTPVL